MNRISKTRDRQVRKTRVNAGKTKTNILNHWIRRRPFDAVAYAAALEVLG